MIKIFLYKHYLNLFISSNKTFLTSSNLNNSMENEGKEKSTKQEENQNKPWFVYLLECKDGSFYTGITNNLDKRMKTHEQGKGSKYVKHKGFKQLLRFHPCLDKSQACQFEYQIKQLSKTLRFFSTKSAIH